MPYQAEKDATIPRVIASGTNDAGEATATYESVTYAAGAVIYEDDIAPHILQRLDEGDDHLSQLLRYIDETEAREILAQQAADAGVEVEEKDVLLHEEEREGDAPTIEPGWDNEDSATEEVASAEEAELTEEVEEEPVKETEETEPESPEEEVAETETAETETAETEEPESTEEEAVAEEETETEEAGEEEASAEVGDESGESTEAEDLDSMSKRELNRKARALNIEGRSKMNEEELRAAISEAEAE